MSDKKRNNNCPKSFYVPVSIAVSGETHVDNSAVIATLGKLRLKTEAQREQFSEKNNYGNIVAYSLNYIHFGKKYTGVTKAVPIAGQMPTTIKVVEIVNQIKIFLGQVVAKEISEGKSWARLNPKQQPRSFQSAYDCGYFNGRQWNARNEPDQGKRAAPINYFDAVLLKLRAGQEMT